MQRPPSEPYTPKFKLHMRSIGTDGHSSLQYSAVSSLRISSRRSLGGACTPKKMDCNRMAWVHLLGVALFAVSEILPLTKAAPNGIVHGVVTLVYVQLRKSDPQLPPLEEEATFKPVP